MAEPEPDHYWIAVEHYVYWRSRGLTHADMLAAIGITAPPWTLDAELVVRYLAKAHRELLQLKRAA